MSVNHHCIPMDFPAVEETFDWCAEAFGPQDPKRLNNSAKPRQILTAQVQKEFSLFDFDFRSVPKNLISGARHYECARQAVIEAGLMLPAKQFPDLLLQEIYDHYVWECVGRKTVFGPIWYLRFCDPGPLDFPLSPFQSVAAKFKNPVWFSRSLENRWRAFHSMRGIVSVPVPVGLSKQEASEYFLKEYIREGACSERGAGASVRRDRIILKYLVARRALDYCRRSEGFRDSEDPFRSMRAHRLVWSKLVADATVFTADILGEPLLKSEQEWAKAQHFTGRLLTKYQSEIEWLRELFCMTLPSF
jgi:hypothetical protein